MTKKIISSVSILGMVLAGFVFPQEAKAAANITIASARITSPTTVVVSFNDPGHALSSTDVSRWHIDANGGGSDSINPVTATVTSATAPWEVTLTFKDGALDTSFDPGFGVDNVVESVAVQGDGKILVGGFFFSYNFTPRTNIARINTDGSLDETFDPGFGADGTINSVAVQDDGKILIGGEFSSYNFDSRNSIARINTNGTLDTSFDPGMGANNDVESVAVQDDGKILIGGEFSSYHFDFRNKIARINTDGTLDTSFDPGTGANDIVESFVLQDDGKIIIGGGFTTYNDIARSKIARINTDGSLDTSFDPGTGANGAVESVVLQDDGKIIIGGWFTTYNDISRNGIARINTDGSLDTSFDPGNGVNSTVNSVAVQDDGKIIIGGWFTTYNDISRNGIARINTDGTLDTSFDPGTGANGGIVESFVLQDDGKIIVGGLFFSYNSTIRGSIARISSGNPTPFSDTASVYPSATGLYADDHAVRDANGDINILVGHAASVEITDAQAPTVVTVVPADSATSVTRSNDIVITFSEPMNTNTWDGSFSTATVPTSPAITYTPAWTAGDTVSTLSHTQSFYGSKVYTGTITTGLEDANGNAIAEYDWSFTSRSSGSSTVTTATTYGTDETATTTNSESSTDDDDEEVAEEEEEEEAAPASDYTGCTSGVGFSTTTGKSCAGNVTPTTAIPGCDGRATGFSVTTGKSCVGNTVLPSSSTNSVTTVPTASTTASPTTTATSSYAFGDVTVSLWYQGPSCRAWQQFLNDKAGASLSVDGLCGPMTISTAKTWQASVGLVPDGLLGSLSRAKALIH